MTFYLDDDSVDAHLIALLRKGDAVVLPVDVGMAGTLDPRHLGYAARNGLVFITKNHDDYVELHNLILNVGGHHPGILVARFDNNRRRDMRPKEIAMAVAKVKRAMPSLVDEFVILNQWR